MKIAIAGLFHLGCVMSACLAKIGHEVIAYDPDKAVIDGLNHGRAPLFEPGLDDLLKLKNLHFTTHPSELRDIELLIVAFDTPVDENDIADSEFVLQETLAILSEVPKNTLILISSQVPVGSTRHLQRMAREKYPDKTFSFGYMPENLRLGKAIDVFMHPDRFVVGLEKQSDQDKIRALLAPITDRIVWMSIESAEMTKHALNAFLATSVVFINELATLCEQVGANAYDVERGLKSEERIGPKSYLKPGGAIAGGTLLRDVNYLNQLNQRYQQPSHFMSALLSSNLYHKTWLQRKIKAVLSDLKHKTIAVLGLAYKPNTNTLRRSSAVETARWLHEQGAHIKAHDPLIDTLPEELSPIIQLHSTIAETLQSADALIIATECPEFRDTTINQWISTMKRPFIFDPGSFLSTTLDQHDTLAYFAIGRST